MNKPSEADRARIRRVLAGLPANEGRRGNGSGGSRRASLPSATDRAVLEEIRAMRAEVASLRALLTEARAPAEPDRVLTRRAAAELMQCCAESVTKFVRENGLPCRRIGGKEYRFMRSEVVAWMEARAR